MEKIKYGSAKMETWRFYNVTLLVREMLNIRVQNCGGCVFII